MQINCWTISLMLCMVQILDGHFDLTFRPFMEWLLSFRRFLPDITIHALIKKDVRAASYPGTAQDDSTKAEAATLARDKATPSPSTRVEPPVIPALQQTYSWGLGFRNSILSKGFILPKPTHNFAKARPLVHYSTAWARKLGSAISTLLIEILNTVFRSILVFPDVRAVIEGIRRLFAIGVLRGVCALLASSRHCWFYNQVQLSGILMSLCLSCTRMHRKPNKVSTLSCRLTFTSWNVISKQYFSVTLRHIPAIVQYLLDNSYFTGGSQVFRQCRGASMGSQFAPVPCSAVALQRQWNYHLSFSPFTWDRSLHHRFVDNQDLLGLTHS